jgi:hypothetical protein
MHQREACGGGQVERRTDECMKLSIASEKPSPYAVAARVTTAAWSERATRTSSGMTPPAPDCGSFDPVGEITATY